MQLFFLGTLLTNIPFPIPEPPESNIQKNLCGSCKACISICPTDAIIAPKILDARRCISYLTIENKKSIPKEFRKAIGTRIYGCDDCQLICPWNRYAKLTKEPDFLPREIFKSPLNLITLLTWDKATFLKKTEGSAMRRIGYISWIRNLAIAAGNSRDTPDNTKILIQTLKNKHPTVRNTLAQEHIEWAIQQLQQPIIHS